MEHLFFFWHLNITNLFRDHFQLQIKKTEYQLIADIPSLPVSKTTDAVCRIEYPMNKFRPLFFF